MNGLYIIIGGNLGNRLANLNTCTFEIENRIGAIERASHIYETASWGEEKNPPYLNQVLFLRTHKKAQEILRICLEIEESMGRIRKQQWESRLIDIDILFLNNEIIHQEHLIIPHPHISDRKFVLVPLNEIAGDFIHPVYKKNIAFLLSKCKDKLPVKLFA